GHVVGMEFAVHLRFAHAPRDELRDLRAEIENQDLVVHEEIAESREPRVKVQPTVFCKPRSIRPNSSTSASTLSNSLTGRASTRCASSNCVCNSHNDPLAMFKKRPNSASEPRP